MDAADATLSRAQARLEAAMAQCDPQVLEAAIATAAHAGADVHSATKVYKRLVKMAAVQMELQAAVAKVYS